jgi:hypothetical protein
MLNIRVMKIDDVGGGRFYITKAVKEKVEIFFSG